MAGAATTELAIAASARGGILLAVFFIDLGAAAITGMKGKWGCFVLGFLFPVVWYIAAIRLAKPGFRLGAPLLRRSEA